MTFNTTVIQMRPAGLHGCDITVAGDATADDIENMLYSLAAKLGYSMHLRKDVDRIPTYDD